jgi:hypothetical protein
MGGYRTGYIGFKQMTTPWMGITGGFMAHDLVVITKLFLIAILIGVFGFGVTLFMGLMTQF